MTTHDKRTEDLIKEINAVRERTDLYGPTFPPHPGNPELAEDARPPQASDDRQRKDKSLGHVRYEHLVEETFAEIRKLGELKGGEYAGDDDRLSNFRRNAAALGITIETVWSVYAGKHWDAISQYVKDRQAGKSRMRMESLEGRCDDLIVYLLLFKLMLQETRSAHREQGR